MTLFNIGSVLFAGLFLVTLMVAWIVDRIVQARKDADDKARRRIVSTPSEGGCWYCYTEDDDLSFSWEFDCYVHKECLRAILREDPNDPEARIMAAELLTVPEDQPWETRCDQS